MVNYIQYKTLLVKMPANKFALIRYKTIDECLQNKYKKWTLDDLVEACSEALYEYEGVKRGVSKRTIQLDLQTMRSSKLGYDAPIVVDDKKYYRYEDPKYSITHIPISNNDLQTLGEAINMLKQFKGFAYYQELSAMVSKLEGNIYKQKHQGRMLIDFEKNELLKGLDWIEPLLKMITNKEVISVKYKSFKAKEEQTLIFSPYLLKEYRNRWFLLGSYKKNLQLLALDRIVNIDSTINIDFHPIDEEEISTFFDNVIGVTKTRGQKETEVIFEANTAAEPYISTKPLHSSQKIIGTTTEGNTIFSITVVLNFELERELMGFGETIKVLQPMFLVKKISKKVQKITQLYAKTE